MTIIKTARTYRQQFRGAVQNSRSSRREVFCKEIFLKISQNSRKKTLMQSLFSKVEKKDSGTSVFLWILRNFQEHIFLWNTSDGCSKIADFVKFP